MPASSSLKVPFMPSSKRIVYEPRIVNSVLIDDQAADQSTELQKGVPIALRCGPGGEASRANTAPASPLQIAASRRSKPGRAVPP